MTEMLDVVNAISLPLQAAWVVWLTWAGCELVSYRRPRPSMVVAVATVRLPLARPGRRGRASHRVRG